MRREMEREKRGREGGREGESMIEREREREKEREKIYTILCVLQVFPGLPRHSILQKISAIGEILFIEASGN